MKKLIFILLLSPFFGFGQQITFQIIYGGEGYDEARSVCQTADGGYIVAGISGSYPSGNSDVFLLKADSLGAIEWFKLPGGTNLQGGYCVDQTSDLGFIVAGLTDNGGFGGYDVYLMKTDVNGDSLWSKTFGGADWDFGYYVEETSDNGFIIGGTTFSFDKAEQMYLVKTDANGDTLWTKTYGGAGQENAKCVRQCSDGGYIITGYTTSYGAGGKDVYILKTNSNGDSLWSKIYGTVNEEEGTFVDLTTGDGYIVCGNYDNYQDGKDYVTLIKLTSAGTEEWVRYMGSSNADEYANSIRQTIDGGYAYGGYVVGVGAGEKDFRLLKVNPGGYWQWGRNAGGADDDVSYAMQTTTDGGFVLAGITHTYGHDPVNAMVVKTDTIGGYYNPVTIGVDDVELPGSFQIFPNPASDFVSIIMPSDVKPLSIQLFDAAGRSIFRQDEKSIRTSNNLMNIDVADLEDGLYLLRVESSQGSATKRLIISR